MKILLIQPPHYYEGGKRPPESFPLGLAYISKALLDAKVDVEVLDIWAHDYIQEQVVKKIKEMSFDVVGISAISSQYGYVKWLANELKKISDVPIVVGGALATLSPDIVIKNSKVDVCVIGEGEVTAVEVVKNINDLRDVDGIFFKDNKKIIVNKPREYRKNLDEIPFPAWDVLPIEIYFRNMRIGKFSNLRTMNVISARGCPFRCRFCSKTFKGVRLRSVKNIVKEIKELKKKFGIEAIIFSDELVVVNRERTYELCDGLEKLNIIWGCQGRVNTVDYDILKRMKEAGCVDVGYGMESGSQKILDNMNKQITVQQSEKAIEEAFRAKLDVTPQMMFGYLGETRETLLETVNLFKRIKYVGGVGLSITTALPGTELYEYAKKKGLIKNEEKYLESLSDGYMKDKLRDSRSFINFTEFDKEEFFKLKGLVEHAIFLAQMKRYPLRILKDYFVELRPSIRAYGYEYVLKRISVILKRMLVSKSG
jgi:radical SAM superfamily enzyme YgiQ (UPF0313 family)